MTFHGCLSKLLKKVVSSFPLLSSLLPSLFLSFASLPPFFLSFAVIFLLTLDFLKSSFRLTTRLKGRFREFSVDKESAWSAGDPSSIPGSRRSSGEGRGYPLQYSWASLVAQLVKIFPAMWETWVRSLGWEDPLEKEKVTHSSILAYRIPWTV